MEKLKETLSRIEGADYALGKKAQERLDNLTKPPGSLGRLEEFAQRIVEITKNEEPQFINKVIFVMAGDHGVVEEGISAFPQEVTPQMVYNFIRGGAGINVLAKHIGAQVIVVDMGVAKKIKNQKSKIKNFIDKKIGYGTGNIVKGPAMTREEAIKSIEIGIDVFGAEFKKGIDIVGTGDMGIGNTTPSSAVVAAITGERAENVTGRGTGIDARALTRKIEVIKRALSLNKPDAKNPLDVLSKVGGFEIGGLVGVILAAASQRTPVVIDGFISGAAALLAFSLEPKVKDYMFAAHCSAERGHKVILNHIGLEPILDLKLRLGEGTGAALGINIIEAGIKILTRMATFQDAGVSQKEPAA
ncbi:MAG: Nicotinate-nucleotide--dimethylbenzimidazole phosphoribosyltransferase [Syntrophomonadaceae bacterium]|nr:Nicotinate-nucleotide--dimethylbenzimidazole phosphoribosyltransferase [Bacillota bacterium]